MLGSQEEELLRLAQVHMVESCPVMAILKAYHTPEPTLQATMGLRRLWASVCRMSC